MKSEHTKNMSAKELAELRKEVESMTPDQLAEFRNSFDADEMGFDGKEGEIE